MDVDAAFRCGEAYSSRIAIAPHCDQQRPINNIHDSHVRNLLKSRDWSALVRYWMAHLHDPALEEAIGLLRQCRKAETSRQLIEFLEDVRRRPIDPYRPTPAALKLHYPASYTPTGTSGPSPFPGHSNLGNASDRAL